MTTRKLYGKDLSAYEDLDVDQLLEQLSPEEIDILAKEVDPDVSLHAWFSGLIAFLGCYIALFGTEEVCLGQGICRASC